MPKLLGIDIGTTACKAILINERGETLAQASAEYPLLTPKPGWSEQNPEDWWHAVQDCLNQINTTPDAIGLTGQMHGSVFLDQNNEVIRPALLWNDQRTTQECREIEDRVPNIREITRNPPLTGFQAPKILWLRNNEPENYAKLRKVLLPKDYIRYKLTQTFATDASDASGTGLLDVSDRTWSEEILDKLDLSADLLPTSKESTDQTGTCGNIPVFAGAGDQAAAAVSTGATEEGVVSVSLGTSGVIFTCLEKPDYDPAGSVHTLCHANGNWHAMAVMLSCGGAIRWYRDTFQPGRPYEELTKEAETAETEALFLPYLAGERSPHNDPDATASFHNLTLATSRAQLTRAVFEGITFGLKDCLEALKALNANPQELRVTGGGAKSHFWLQLLADILETPVVALEADGGPALGAALIAGTGLQIWPDVTAASKATLKEGKRFRPSGKDYANQYIRFRERFRTMIRP